MLNYAKKNALTLIFFILTSCLTTVLSIVLPYLNGVFIDSISSQPRMQTIYFFVIFILTLSTISIFITYIFGILSVKIKLELSFDSYQTIVKHIQGIPLLDYKKYNPTYLNQRISTDVDILWEFFLNYIINIIIQAISIVTLLYLVFSMSIKIFLAVVLLIPVYVGIYFWSRKPLYTFGLRSKESAATYFKTGNEQLELVAQIKANSLYNSSESWLQKGYKTYFRNIIHFTKVTYFFKSLDSAVSTLLSVGVLMIGGIEIIHNHLTLGEFVVINSYTTMLFKTIKFFFTVGQEYQGARNSYFRINEILSIPVEKFGEYQIDDINTIKLNHIKFQYTNKQLLQYQSMEFHKGNIYIIEGGNGTGKTTFILLLLGMLKPAETSELIFNSTSIQDLNMLSLRKNNISTYIQNMKCFDGSVYDNLSYISEMDKDSIVQRIYAMELQDMYLNESFNIEKIFDKRVLELSGGEQQKVILLGNLLLDREVLILDEPTSEMDEANVTFLCSYLRKISSKKTVIIITHDKKIAKGLDVYIAIHF